MIYIIYGIAELWSSGLSDLTWPTEPGDPERRHLPAKCDSICECECECHGECECRTIEYIMEYILRHILVHHWIAVGGPCSIVRTWRTLRCCLLYGDHSIWINLRLSCQP